MSVQLAPRLAASHGLSGSIVAGVGCRRGTSATEIIGLIQTCLAGASLAAIATLASKADEPGLIAAARYFGVPLHLFAANELAAADVPNASSAVLAHIGIASVAEAAALKAGDLLLPRQKSANATCALGWSATPLDWDQFGRAAQ